MFDKTKVKLQEKQSEGTGGTNQGLIKTGRRSEEVQINRRGKKTLQNKIRNNEVQVIVKQTTLD